MKEQIEEISCEKCLHHLACLTNSEYVPTPCPAYEDKAGYRKQEWISVEDRLPTRPGAYLVFTIDRRISMCHFIDHYCDGDMQFDDYRVTHWMPLPEPPLKGGAE